ncbi:unnamed protein product [Phaedon cochleariae]|uniref:Myb/SANT-like DNA-binding domain-containing protein n=1 Tax=Phaedon cochleariae TaxID=80249 RepID=A0A9N9SEI4_PHACE|nr:unnamed protein product [Phaedon cochleariae]
MNQNIVSETPTQKEKFIWPRSAVLLLLDEIERRKKEMKLPHKKRYLFGNISKCLLKKGYRVSWECCDRKWKGLQATYKKITEKESHTGSANRSSTWEFYSRLEEILADDPAHKPLATAAAGIVNENVTLPKALGASSSNLGRSRPNKRTAVSAGFSEINSNIVSLKNSIDQMITVQKERNVILDRLTTAIETFTKSQN